MFTRKTRRKGDCPLPEPGPTGCASVISARTGSPITAATSGVSCTPCSPAAEESCSLVAPETAATIPVLMFCASVETDCPAEGLVTTSISVGSGTFGSGPALPETSASEILPSTALEITAPAPGGTDAPASEMSPSMRSLVAPETPPTMPVKAFSIRAVVEGLTAGLVNNSMPAGSGAGGCPVGGTPTGGPDRLAKRCE
jgi:hypothetical protein